MIAYLDEFPKRPRQYAEEILEACYPEVDDKPESVAFMVAVGVCIEALVPEPIQHLVIYQCLHHYHGAQNAKAAKARVNAQKQRAAIVKSRGKGRVYEVQADAQKSRCTYCRKVIFWQHTMKGNKIPLNPDGVAHFDTCEYQSQVPRSR